MSYTYNNQGTRTRLVFNDNLKRVFYDREGRPKKVISGRGKLKKKTRIEYNLKGRKVKRVVEYKSNSYYLDHTFVWDYID